ncbi:hypothetical protein DICPUDRAFT_85446 [Dictyostelium purpureum]|uniref:Uncharacterized protein n=1 Tax=Dictyostelium purpureum TaxID=5786 RepID=F1A5R7_DICPU|nr:uncharacterized protein DICPUDRAFT_85446 [Dictyostelium purpureum]EGC28462.1 hypothetical protein DICPUDRAFT_85446 [Dictyostelium purpureum]|eukprot:XP_003295010.1 hypothetical protein DICPUDRAFT_85446 [Dictyostelium purpureum]
MVPQQQELICSLELECSRKFGNSKYSFYYPIQLENFLINCWKTSTSSESQLTAPSNSFLKSSSSYNGNSSSASPADRFCCIIYENGSVVLPSVDIRMRNFSWAKTFSKRNDFSKEELETLLSDIYTQCCYH